MSFLTKSKPSMSTQESGNNNAGLITSSYTPQIEQGTGASNFLAQLLGTAPGAETGAQPAYQNFLQTAGYAPAFTELSKNITGQRAAAGALGSGAYVKDLMKYGGQLNNQFFNNYLQQLSGLSGMGQNAGQMVTSAGQYSKGTSVGPQKSMLEQIAGAAQTAGSLAATFSDRRLKTDIKLLDRAADGLGRYEFRYIGKIQKFIGVMADEVAQLRPWALGPKVAGYATVNYGAL